MSSDGSAPPRVKRSWGLAALGGDRHSLAVKSNGEVWAWGWNGYGQLGDNTLTDRLSPVQTNNPGGSATAVAVSAGWYHSLALRSDGTLWARGSNSFGQLGDDTRTTRLTPVRVVGLDGVVSIGAGASLSLAVKGDGTAWGWGHNDFGLRFVLLKWAASPGKEARRRTLTT